MKALVIIPTYNEKENIVNIINAVLKQGEDIDILIVDDNSPDKTGDIVESLNNLRVFLLRRAGKLGLGTAYTDGFKYALQHNYEYILEMDADFSHNPNDIPKLISAAKNYDLAIGSRYVQGINVVNWPMSRLILSYMASIYVRMITGMKVCDPTGGFKCFRRKVLESIDLDNILSDGYSFQVEMNYRTYQKGFKIKEVPIVFTDRVNGVSKMSKKIIIEAIWMVWKLRLMALQGKLK